MSKSLVLCGGCGQRMKGNFDNIPKPLILINGKSLLENIINQYVKFGIEEFVLLVGANENLFIDFANNYHNKNIKIHVLQTGKDTPTGGRIKKAKGILSDNEYFYLTYGDGIANVNIAQQLNFHKNHGKTATITAVNPQLPFGLLELDEDNNVTSFVEKPILEKRINGGFFILNKSVFEYLDESSDFEFDILPKLSAENQLKAYMHNGFWKNIDTYKDYLYLETDDYLKDLNSENTKR
jgi:glucose-1-phosphate cytidylyltransferase